MMGSHISNLISKSLKSKNKSLNYIIPKSVNISQIKNKFSFLNINTKKIILIHIDEKWHDHEGNVSHLISIINILKNKSVGNYLLVITNGVLFTRINKSLIQYFSNDKTTNADNFSTDFNNKKYLFFEKN